MNRLIALFSVSCFCLSGAWLSADDDFTFLRPEAPSEISSAELRSSMDRGVKYLIESQRADGAWGGPQWTGGVDSDPVPGSFRSFDVAVTALCLEALMDAEESPEIRQAKDKAFKFLMDRTDRIRRAGPGDLPHVWSHCYCIQTFAKMLEATGDETQASELRKAIERHAKGLDRWQSVHGGWFYYGSGMSKPINPSCSFVNAAVLVALARARDVGVETDQKMIDRALKATRLMRKPDASFIYSIKISTDKTGAMRPINRPAGSLGRSQACNMALYLWQDAKTTPTVMGQWLNRLISRHGWLDMGRKRPIPHESHAAVAGYFYYFGMYYGALCIDTIPASERPFYQHHLAKLLIERQETDGSWFDYPLYSYHKPYGTAFALLSLKRCELNEG